MIGDPFAEVDQLPGDEQDAGQCNGHQDRLRRGQATEHPLPHQVLHPPLATDVDLYKCPRYGRGTLMQEDTP